MLFPAISLTRLPMRAPPARRRQTNPGTVTTKDRSGPQSSSSKETRARWIRGEALTTRIAHQLHHLTLRSSEAPLYDWFWPIVTVAPRDRPPGSSVYFVTSFAWPSPPLVRLAARPCFKGLLSPLARLPPPAVDPALRLLKGLKLVM